jgi:DNA-binding transcriptional ArsR family regulator
MIESDFRQLEKLFLALGDKTRLRLLALMADGEVAVGFLAERLGESQPKVSRHLAYLRAAGLVYTRREGKWIYYGISYPENTSQRRILETVVRSIAVMRVDGEYVYFTGADIYTDQIFAPENDTYEQANMYLAEHVNETGNDLDSNLDTIEGITGEESEYEADQYYDEPEQMDVFLL